MKVIVVDLLSEVEGLCREFCSYDEVLAVVLYGSVTSDYYSDVVSDINVAIILAGQKLRKEILLEAGKYVGFQPLLLTQEELRNLAMRGHPIVMALLNGKLVCVRCNPLSEIKGMFVVNEYTITTLKTIALSNLAMAIESYVRRDVIRTIHFAFKALKEAAVTQVVRSGKYPRTLREIVDELSRHGHEETAVVLEHLAKLRKQLASSLVYGTTLEVARYLEVVRKCLESILGVKIPKISKILDTSSSTGHAIAKVELRPRDSDSVECFVELIDDYGRRYRVAVES